MGTTPNYYRYNSTTLVKHTTLRLQQRDYARDGGYINFHVLVVKSSKLNFSVNILDSDLTDRLAPAKFALRLSH